MGVAVHSVAPMRGILPALLLLLCGPATAEVPAKGNILIFSHTTGFRHDSIPAGTAAVADIATKRGLTVTKSEDPELFSSESLKRFRVIIFLSTTTDPKNPASEWLTGNRRTALREFVARGGGILAIHAAADSHYYWPWYTKLIGGHFERHPPGTPKGSVTALLPRHPAMRGLPSKIERVDEWYYFDDLDPTSTFLMTLDPKSIGESDANPNPMVWTREVDGGRVFYTAMGHTRESYSEAFFLAHLANGLDWLLAAPAGKATERK